MSLNKSVRFNCALFWINYCSPLKEYLTFLLIFFRSISPSIQTIALHYSLNIFEDHKLNHEWNWGQRRSMHSFERFRTFTLKSVNMQNVESNSFLKNRIMSKIITFDFTAKLLGICCIYIIPRMPCLTFCAFKFFITRTLLVFFIKQQQLSS